ncbi:MAG: flagellar basal body-associated FliL family protein [Gammaproteobacteria bacterium]
MSGTDATADGDEVEVAASAEPKRKSAPAALKWIGIAIGMFAIVTVSQIVTEMVKARMTPAEAHAAADTEAAAKGDAGTGKDSKKALPPPIYVALEPPLVVSFEGPGAMRFLQLTVEVMARDAKVIEAVEQHNPVIRNNLLMLVGGTDLKMLSNREGKEELRAAALAEVQAVVENQTGEPGVEDLYFTSFVVQ